MNKKQRRFKNKMKNFKYRQKVLGRWKKERRNKNKPKLKDETGNLDY